MSPSEAFKASEAPTLFKASEASEAWEPSEASEAMEVSAKLKTHSHTLQEIG